ncbi:MAG: N-acetylmuramic acid 6-phosphate etherase, partial [Ruminiclostridium sp.]|nr:N-acetylmuramic acid 6-phosphate etherase [Ruminiclostridium sp.]
MSLNLKNMSTETRNQNTMNLDIMSPLEVVTVMNQEDAKVPAAITPALPNIAQCVTWAIESIEAGGRIIYMGAGTSGRLGVLDAVECPPTFGVAPEVVVGLIAGGEKAFVKAVEGAEDSRELGRQDLIDINLEKRDIVIGIAASGRTPYVLGGLAYAQEVGCHTVGISCNPGSAVGA